MNAGATDVPKWSILYRGPLSSCNYACSYCPFAKTRNTREELEEDATRLGRFVDWVESRAERIGVLFTPWGEALIHRSYQEALRRLSRLPNVWRAAIQTNLFCRLDWTERCDLDKLALWTTYHPTETTREKFLSKCQEADARGVRFSVGVVGRREAFEDIRRLREALPPHVYLWVNAWKREAEYYSEEELAMLEGVDPWFRFNVRAHASLGRACHAGHTAFTVDGEGEARRCHFIPERIGNIYDERFADRLRPLPCSNQECRCHIGYVHMPGLGLYDVFGDGLLERIPARWPAQVSASGR
jgi:MoaA/NifB/PqqE/SkfB family radical SAM enzyme